MTLRSIIPGLALVLAFGRASAADIRAERRCAVMGRLSSSA